MSDNLNQNSTVEFKPHPQIEDYTVEGFKYYHSGTQNFRMIRKDGKSIVFNQHFFESDQSGDIEYLDEEINKYRNIHLRYANENEIREAHYRKDPKKTILEEAKKDPDFINELKAQWLAELHAEQNGGHKTELPEPDKGANKVVETGTAKVTLTPLEVLKAHQPAPLKPMNTGDVAGNTASSTQAS